LLESMRSLSYLTIARCNDLERGGGGRGEIHKLTAASALHSARSCMQILDETVQIHGGYGFMAEDAEVLHTGLHEFNTLPEPLRLELASKLYYLYSHSELVFQQEQRGLIDAETAARHYGWLFWVHSWPGAVRALSTASRPWNCSRPNSPSPCSRPAS